MPELDIQLVEIPLATDIDFLPDQSIGVANNLSPECVLREAIRLGLSHIVQKTNADFERAVGCSKLMLKNQKTFLEFPISTILEPDRAGPEAEVRLTIFEFNFENAGAKIEMLDELEKALGDRIPRTLRYDLSLIADELFSNACYNAPYPSPDAQTNEVSRQSREIQQATLRPGVIRVGISSDFIVVACVDAYGSLDPHALLKRLLRCFEDGSEKSIKMGNGGAGLGSMMVYSASSGFFVGVESGVKSVVAALVSRSKHKTRLENSKTLNLFAKGPNS